MFSVLTVARNLVGTKMCIHAVFTGYKILSVRYFSTI